jgi:hypothetical protein
MKSKIYSETLLAKLVCIWWLYMTKPCHEELYETRINVAFETKKPICKTNNIYTMMPKFSISYRI